MLNGQVSFHGNTRGVSPGTKADRNDMARADVIIENGTVVGEGGVVSADVVIADERIAALTLDAGDWPAAERINATGLWLIPGGIDTHTHFEEPDPRLLEGFASGSAGAGRCPEPLTSPEQRARGAPRK